MLLLEDLCNRSPSFGALIIREETPSLLPVGFLEEGLTQLTQQHCGMVSQGFYLILLLLATGGAALSCCPFRLGVSYQACVETPLPEVHPLH